jgi:hypothetical protein
VATYAAVLDGAHLWLEVEGAQGRLALRPVGGGGDTVELGEGPHDVTGLTADAYDVVAGRTRVAVGADLQRPLTRSPLAPDGVSRWEPQDDGGLRLVRSRVPATAELDAVELRGERIHLRLRPPGTVEAGSHLLLLDQDDALLVSLPVTAHHAADGDLVEALVGVDDLPPGWFGMLRVALGTDTGERRVRVRRRGDDLRDANHAVLLPELHDDGRLRARLRWNPDGLLALRSLDPTLGPEEQP